MHDTALVVFARAPEYGRAKTRLAQAIGAGAALAVYRQLLAHTGRVAAGWQGPVLVATAGDVTTFDGTGLERHLRCPQATGTLGEALSAALRAGSELAEAAIIIGTDCPSLTIAALRCIEQGTYDCDAAFGPASDGGFWALGSRSPAAIDLIAHRALPWSSPTTLRAARDLLHGHGLRTRLGPTLADVDTIDDLRAAVRAGLLDWPRDALA